MCCHLYKILRPHCVGFHIIPPSNFYEKNNIMIASITRRPKQPHPSLSFEELSSLSGRRNSKYNQSSLFFIRIPPKNNGVTSYEKEYFGI